MIIYNKLIKEELENSWINNGHRILPGQMKFSHFVWNLVHPGNRIIKGDGYVIHHKDSNKLNDDIKNLEKITHSEHLSIHKKKNNYFKGKKHSLKTRKRMSASQSGKKHSLKTRKRMSDSKKGENNSMYGKSHSDESRKKMKDYWEKYFIELGQKDITLSKV